MRRAAAASGGDAVSDRLGRDASARCGTEMKSRACPPSSLISTSACSASASTTVPTVPADQLPNRQAARRRRGSRGAAQSWPVDSRSRSGMSTQVDVRGGGPSASTIQVAATGLVAPLRPSTIATTSYVTANGVMRVDRTVASASAPRIASWRYRQSAAVIPRAGTKTRALCRPRSWPGSSAYGTNLSVGMRACRAFGSRTGSSAISQRDQSRRPTGTNGRADIRQLRRESIDARGDAPRLRRRQRAHVRERPGGLVELANERRDRSLSRFTHHRRRYLLAATPYRRIPAAQRSRRQ